jgi:hypothetical protein
MNRVWSIAWPTHHAVAEPPRLTSTPGGGTNVAGLNGTNCSGVNFSLPPTRVRNMSSTNGVLPYTCDASHQWVSVFRYDGVPPSDVGGPGRVRSTRIGRSKAH